MASLAAGLAETLVTHAPRRRDWRWPAEGAVPSQQQPALWGQRCCHIRWCRLRRCSLSGFLRGEGRRRPGRSRSPGQGARSPGQGCLPACAPVCLAEALPGSLGLPRRAAALAAVNGLRTAQGSRPPPLRGGGGSGNATASSSG